MCDLNSFCGQISEKNMFSLAVHYLCLLTLFIASFVRFYFHLLNVAAFVSIFLHCAGFSVSHCKTASPPCCHKNVVPIFFKKLKICFPIVFLNLLAVLFYRNVE